MNCREELLTPLKFFGSERSCFNHSQLCIHVNLLKNITNQSLQTSCGVHILKGRPTFFEGVTFPKEKGISSFSASPELCMEATKTEEEKKKTLWFLGQIPLSLPRGTRLSRLVLKILINTFVFVGNGDIQKPF